MSLFDYLKESIINVEDVAPHVEDIPSDMNKNYEDDNTAVNPDSKYYNTKDPDTGFRYDIPLLSTIDPAYYSKYVRFMKLRERSESTFDKIMRWE